jgi:hypothetical protein
MTNDNLQNTTQKTKHRATRALLKTGGELIWSAWVGSSCSTCDTRRVTVFEFFFCCSVFLIGTGFASGSFISINIYSDFVYFMFVINLTKYNTRDMNRSFCTHTRFTFQLMFVSFNSNTTGVTCGAGTSYPCGSYEFTPGF